MPPPRKILIVDDEQHILQVLTLKLRNAGYEVLTAVDGEEGFDVACRELPALIITDFQMPYMTGLELCQHLAAQGETAHIPVVLLTARGYALDEKDLLVGNIRDVLNKPFSPRSIVQQVDALLNEPGESAGGTGQVADDHRSARPPAPAVGQPPAPDVRNVNKEAA